MTIMHKVRIPRLRPPEPSPKEQQAWENFLALARELRAPDGSMPKMVMDELERLCAKGNPTALRFKERLAIAAFQPRAAGDPAAPRPQARRIRGLKWQHRRADDEQGQ